MMSRLSATWMWAMCVVMLPVVGLLVGCREHERGVSGEPWDCACVLESGEDGPLAHVCTVTLGEAVELARQCASSSGMAIQFCDCVESTTDFCEIGECSVE